LVAWLRSSTVALNKSETRNNEGVFQVDNIAVKVLYTSKVSIYLHLGLKLTPETRAF